MPTEITAYQCNWCRYVSRTKAGILNHERNCKYNPATKSCMTCKHYEKPMCKYFNQPMSEKPYYNECETVAPPSYHDLDDEDYYRLPGTCFNYELKESEDNTNEIQT